MNLFEEMVKIFYSDLRTSRSEWVIGRNRLAHVMNARDYSGEYMWQKCQVPMAFTILGLPFVVSDKEPDALYLREIPYQMSK